MHSKVILDRQAIGKAAQAVTATALGLPLEPISVDHDHVASGADFKQQMLLSLVGPIAEHRFTRSGETVDIDDDNKAEAGQLLRLLPKGLGKARTLLSLSRMEARKLVNDNWPTILAVARKLHEKTLPAAAVSKIVNDSLQLDAPD